MTGELSQRNLAGARFESGGPHVRDATPEDAKRIAELFNELIPTTTVAWREQLSTEQEQRDWLFERERRGHPTLVAEDAGTVVGYCCLTSFRGGDRFPGYRHTVEHTIHIDGARQGEGVGRLLLEALIERAREQRVHVMVAGIDADNDASIGFHRAMGFEEVARMPETGRKFDRWLDLVLMQRLVDT